MSQEDRRNISNLYNLLTIEQLQQKYKNIPWLKFINNIMPEVVKVNCSQTILVGVPYYIEEFQQLIVKTPKK